MTSKQFRLVSVVVALALWTTAERPGDTVQAQAGCVAAANPILCENAKAGAPAAEWDVTGAGDASLQGFATEFSVIPGQTQRFKIDTTAASYTIDIYRMGYYGGMGARKVASVTPATATNQPNCLTNAPTGLIDCGNWSVSASWVVPPDAVSGIYFAKLTRVDNGGSSHIMFVVRDDTGGSELLFQTSDTTWQAYNNYGGNSLYQGNPDGRAYKVSYNRPFNTRANAPEDWVFNAEYPMVRWIEANGYDVSYTSGIDSDRRGAELSEHKIFLSVGHDEYWSGTQRANVESARDGGLHLAFFSGNSVFWKTRWENSIDGTGTPYRTLVCYKETHANAKIDPTPAWTGTWRDPRFSPPADGGRPENSLMGTIFMVNAGDTTAIQVPSAQGKTRLWRNTSVATLGAGAVATLAAETLGYEWDADLNNGFRPSGLIELSSTTRNVNGMLLDHGSTYGPGTVTHKLTLYRHPGGALVFGGGTVQWAWGLDVNHDRGGPNTPDVRMQQATVNLFADMDAQPDSLQPGLVAATASLDTTAPTTTITSPTAGQSFAAGTPITISGNATESGGGIVGGVEVSVDGGTTWFRASGTTNWTFNWTVAGTTNATIRSRAFDDSGNMETPSAGVTITVTGGGGTCPCTIWAPTAVPSQVDDGDTAAVELGTKFRADTNGFITGVRFYKAPLNTGTHTGKLWTRTGTLLASVTFTGESASGWQQANFPTPVAITANTTYVVSYHAPNGHYTGIDNFFATSLDRGPLHGLRDGVDGGNGVYIYGASAFPTATFQAEGYWVDVVYVQSTGPDTTPPTITATSPANGAGGVSATTTVTATFSEPMDASTIFASAGAAAGTFELRDALNNLVSATVTYDTTTRVATLAPASPLALSQTYIALVRGGSADPRVKDTTGNAMAANASWSFTTTGTAPPPPSCPCSIWSPTAAPPVADSGDPAAVELGTRFRSDVSGFATAVRFYKSAANTGMHVGKLWSNTGALLGSLTFSGETASGWQQANFATPIAIAANTTYVVSYHAPNGHYSGTNLQFQAAGVDNVPLHALRDGVDGANGVYQYGASAFPTNTFQSTGYWVDIVFVSSLGPDTTPPAVISTVPANNASGVNALVDVTVTFNEDMTASTINSTTIELRDPANALVPATVTFNGPARTATLAPSASLAPSTTYTGRVRGGTVDPRVKDLAGNAMTSDHVWSFTTAAPPPPPPTEGPGGPVLVVTSTTNPFSTYYSEILRNEGLNAFTTLNLNLVTATVLANHDVAILGQMPLTAAQVTMFSNWVNAGGNLIAMRPDKQLAALLGLTDAATTLSEGYMLVNTATAPGTGIVNQTMQFHGTADRYTLSGASSIATLYSDATTATSNPAVTIRQVGAGTAVAFTYDLARSVVLTRQGNPAWSGQERDSFPPIRSDDLFFGARAGDVQPDWVNLNKVAIPQADEQQRLLWNVILHSNADKKPLPRFWYFPRMLKAVVIMTGDDHANNGTPGRFDQYIASSPPGCSVEDWECVRSSSYIFSGTAISDAAAASYVAQGFEIGLHVTTNCGDYTPASIADFYSTQLAQFASEWPSLPAPATNRTHCIPFSDYSSQPQVERDNGIRLDTNYYYWPGSWVDDRPGMFTGSGLPMRFATATGQMIDVYQATTQMTDESELTYETHINALLDRALGAEGYYVAVTANMHTDSSTSVGSNTIVAAAQTRGIPVVSAKQMLTWLDGRNGSSFEDITWSGNVLQFDIAVGAGANGLRTLVPASANGAAITSITRNGTTASFTTQTIKGVAYAAVAATAGTYRVSYAAATPQLSIADTSVIEGNGGAANNAVFNVTLSTAGSSAITVDFTTANGTALAGTDYVLTSGTLTFDPGETAQTISVPVLGDTLNEADEQFVVTLSGAVNASITRATGNGVITNDDPLPSISIADVSLAEGNTGTTVAAFGLTLSAASGRTVTAAYATANSSATGGSDYVSTSGTATFAAGATTATVSVLVNGDTVFEPNETFFVNLTTPSNATIARAQATGTITNDDAAPAPALSISDVTVTEGNTGSVNATVNVTLAPASTQTVTVGYATANTTATAGSDYTAASGTVTFLPGETTKPVTIAVTGDTVDEPNETFAVNLSAPVNAVIADAQGIVTITDDDLPPGGVPGLVAAYGFGEGTGTTTADSSGAGNNGTISGAAWSTLGHTGNGLSFDGVNDWVTVLDAPTLDLTTAMTFEAWVRPSVVSGWRTVFLKESPGSSVYEFYANQSANRPAAYYVTGTNTRGVTGTSRLPANTWTHIAATYDGALMRMYVNGVLVRTVNRAGTINTSASPLRIGGSATQGEFFAGRMDDVRIYNRALTQAEIVTDMNTPVTP